MNGLKENDPVIGARRVVKKFGVKTALRGIDLTLKRGDFLALFGPNGAGKTTLLHILCSLTRPSSGQVRVAGYDSRHHREALCRSIGVVSHQTFLYHDLTALENLTFYGRMYEVPNLPDRIEALLALAGLSEYRHEPVQTFSRGMQQRLSVARAIIHDPLILFFDEPYTGLDQQGAEDLKQLLKGFPGQGKTVIMTSHNLKRGLELCTHIAILNSGNLVYKEPVSMIKGEDFEQIYLEFTEKEGTPGKVLR